LPLELKLKDLPTNSGIYQYFDKDGRLLYVGKAKNLKNRIKSYFSFTPTLAPSSKLSARIYNMISNTYDLNYIITPSENDALILENSLIKQLKPKYNILLRDDKTYPYIYIDTNEDFPRLDITRKILKGSNIKYFGPYSIGAKDMLDSIYEIIPLVQKKNCIKGGKACLFYQINKCLAPCEGKVTKQQYKNLIDQALELINNKNKLINLLNKKMQEYSDQFRFEEALELRNRIKSIQKSQIKSSFDFANKENIDLFTIQTTSDLTNAVIIRMFIRDGKIVSSTHNYIKQTQTIDLDEAYKTALINYYSNQLPVIPNEIILAHKLEEHNTIESFIQEKLNKKINITYPKIGKKKQIVQNSIQNAKELLKINTKQQNQTLLQDIKELFNLQNIPQRCEAFDNSHMMGQATVGAMVVFEQNFIRSDFRHYNLNSKDEYAQMDEMLKRRVESFEKNSPPDLWVIDGGKALLDLAISIVNSYGANIDIIAISKQKVDAKAYRAKGAARDIIYTKDQIFKLEPSDKRLQFIQRLRDESHRFAITFHKKQKRSEDKQISLLNIQGIGPAKVAKLLQYFGSFDLIKKASIDDLNQVMNQKDSKTIYQYFKNTN
jgi:excinuclease ABC subunit C